jgi:hypothetical protein
MDPLLPFTRRRLRSHSRSEFGNSTHPAHLKHLAVSGEKYSNKRERADPPFFFKIKFSTFLFFVFFLQGLETIRHRCGEVRPFNLSDETTVVMPHYSRKKIQTFFRVDMAKETKDVNKVLFHFFNSLPFTFKPTRTAIFFCQIPCTNTRTHAQNAQKKGKRLPLIHRNNRGNANNTREFLVAALRCSRSGLISLFCFPPLSSRQPFREDKKYILWKKSRGRWLSKAKPNKLERLNHKTTFCL